MPTTTARSTVPAASAQKELVLVAIAGDVDVGSETPIPRDQPLLIGRSSKGLQLPDPLVSIQHAKISYDPKRGPVIEDLGSATGTWVDEECVKGESRPIGIGTRLRFGDSVFEVQSAHRTPRWIRWVATGAAALSVAALALFLWQGFSAPPVPELACPKAGIVIGRKLDTMPVPPEFLRTRGLSVYDLRCRDVTDYDLDGRDELWISLGPAGDAVITFDDALEWTVLGEFAPNCEQRKVPEGGAESFPEITCGGEHWLMLDGRYQLVSQEGVVVWYRELPQKPGTDARSKAKHKAKAHGEEEEPAAPEIPALELASSEIKVGRFALKSPELMGAFLSFRGVTEPVHYVICEEAFEGIRAQALTVRDRLVDLSVGCISDLRLEGNITAKPVAFALSTAGRRALVDDVLRFYAGSPDGLFLEERFEPLAKQIQADPGYLKGAVKLIGDSKESAIAPLNPIPDASVRVRTSHRLSERDSRLVPAPLATTATIVKEGRSTLDPPGCAELVVETNDFRSYGFRALMGNTFMTVTDVGCGGKRELIDAGYIGGKWDVSLPGLDLRLVTEAGPSVRGLEVRRARITWREQP